MSLRLALIALAACLVVALGAFALLPGGTTNVVQDNSPVPIGGPFELVSETGETVTDQDFAGRYMLLYFGYTYCPDICPTGLATMTAAYDLLPEATRSVLSPVFITVDPERDTREVVADYTALFHDELLGLTGTTAAIEATKGAFRVYAKKVEDESMGDYLVDHSTFTYLIGPDGRYVAHFGHDATADEIADGIAAKINAGVS